jgi:ATP diphosphatase
MALRTGLARFTRRFHAVEAALRARGRDLDAASTAELDALWNQVKATETT